MSLGMETRVKIIEPVYRGRWIYPIEQGIIVGCHTSPAGQEVYDVVLKKDGKKYTFAPSEIIAIVNYTRKPKRRGKMNINDTILKKLADGDFYFRAQIYVNNQRGWIEGHILYLNEESIRQLVQPFQRLFVQHLANAHDNKGAFNDFK